MRRTLFTAFALALFIPAGITSAQSLGGAVGSTDPFTVSVSPQYPAPGTQATLSFVSSTIDLSNASMAVSVNGTKTYQGNVQSTPITLGKEGSIALVSITITVAGTPYTQTLAVQPEDVALIAEPISSAPVLYPGKPLVPLEGSTRVVAIANLKNTNGKPLDPSTLSYSWTVDGTQIADSSGIGKNAIMVASPLEYRERSISVVVESQDGSLVGGDSLMLDPVEPSVQMYANDPLLGILFDHALSGTYAINGTESSLYAAPFSLALSNGNPILQWFLNGSAAQTGNVITLRPSGTGQGNASLTLTASNGETTEATNNLSLSFGSEQSSSFFGL